MEILPKQSMTNTSTYSLQDSNGYNLPSSVELRQSFHEGVYCVTMQLYLSY